MKEQYLAMKRVKVRVYRHGRLIDEYVDFIYDNRSKEAVEEYARERNVDELRVEIEEDQ
jgi:hypothetical protein